MPELPEVETYVRELAPAIAGRTIVAAQVFWPRIIAAPDAAAFPDRVAGLRFTSFGRRGKYMLLGLSDDSTLVVHLRMTGKLLVVPGDTPPTAHTHVVLTLDDGRSLHYDDPRKFGRFWVVADPETLLDAKLGPEPLSDDFTPSRLAMALAGRQAAIKALLLDQAVVAGVGNIYADEALFRAGIHPARAGGTLTRREIARLHEAVRTVLAAGIERQGSSLGGSNSQNYLRPGGERGSFQEEHLVFRRTGQPCATCGTTIERIVIGQRSTHFCPVCQREKRRRGSRKAAKTPRQGKQKNSGQVL
jgi:formamidopyrimidine-DNA glycosylase